MNCLDSHLFPSLVACVCVCVVWTPRFVPCSCIRALTPHSSVAYGCHPAREISAADVLFVNAFVLEPEHSRVILGEHNTDGAMLACLCHHLYNELWSENADLRASAKHIWAALLKLKASG